MEITIIKWIKSQSVILINDDVLLAPIRKLNSTAGSNDSIQIDIHTLRW